MSHVESAELGSWTPKRKQTKLLVFCYTLLLYSDSDQYPVRAVRGGSVGHRVLWTIMTPSVGKTGQRRSQEVGGLVKRSKEQEEWWEGPEGSEIKLAYPL